MRGEGTRSNSSSGKCGLASDPAQGADVIKDRVGNSTVSLITGILEYVQPEIRPLYAQALGLFRAADSAYP
jgi:hypothetical protein